MPSAQAVVDNSEKLSQSPTSKKPRAEDAPASCGEELSEFVITSAGVRMPRLVYGTAWKEDRTEELVVVAIRAGFRGLDTACQPKHYREAGVGAAVKTLLASGIAREDLFIQTKVNKTYAAEMMPDQPIRKQVEAAIKVSLSNLGLLFVDSLLLHSPYPSHEETMEAWREMEAAARAGFTRQLGISNVKSLKHLKRLYKAAELKPAVVQQRFYVKTDFEREMRAWCLQKGVFFQSFWTLTANSKRHRFGRDAVVSSTMRELAAKYAVTPEVLFYRFVMGQGIIPLDGTCSDQHMAEDLGARLVRLAPKDSNAIDALLGHPESEGST